MGMEFFVHAERRGVAFDPARLAIQYSPDRSALGQAARADEDIATVAAQLMSQREVMASWLVDGIMHRSALREGTDRATAVDTVWALMDPVVFCRLTGDRHWTTARFERWFTDSVTRLVLSADNTR